MITNLLGVLLTGTGLIAFVWVVFSLFVWMVA